MHCDASKWRCSLPSTSATGSSNARGFRSWYSAPIPRRAGLWTLCRKATVQNATVQNGRSAEMGNVAIVPSSRVTEWHDVNTRNNQLNKQLKDIMKI